MPEAHRATWNSDEAIEGHRLQAEFTMDADSAPVGVRFWSPRAVEDEIVFGIPRDGSRVRIQQKFRNGLELAGDFRLVAFTDASHAELGVWGHLSYGWPRSVLKIYFEGVMAEFRAPEPPPPPPPPPDDDHIPDEEIVEPDTSGKAFPYVFLRKWSHLCSGPDCQCAYVCYRPPNPPEDTLYEHLAAANPRTWANLQGLVTQFLTGQLATQFPVLKSWNDLTGFIQRFPLVWRYFRQHSDIPLAEAASVALNILDTTAEDLAAYLQGVDFASAKECCWQNYFGYLIKLGCDFDLLDNLAQAILAASLIEWLFTPQDVDPGEAEFRKRIDARIQLEPPVFPLPPPVPCRPEIGTSAPFALGELQLIRHTPAGYRPGDLARVENVMGRERRERTRRHLDRSERSSGERTVAKSTTTSTSASNSSEFFQAALESVAGKGLTVAYDNFQVSYGPPATATLTGSWSANLAPTSPPSQRDLQRLAENLLESTCADISKSVERARRERLVEESEKIDTSIVDNTHSRENLVAVYRWLSRIYKTQVYHCGVRLMIRFDIPSPAAGFLASAEAVSGIILARPVPPAQQGVNTFRDISRDNWIALLASYGGGKEVPPPPPTRMVTVVLRRNETKEAVIPDGYQAHQAWVSMAAANANYGTVNVVLGRQMFSFSGPPPVTAKNLSLNDEEQAMGAAMLTALPEGSPPAYAQDVVLNIEVECHPTPALVDEWRIAVFRAIEEGYQAQLARYRANAGIANAVTGTVSANPALLQDIERIEIQKRCFQILREMNREPFAFIASPPQPAEREFGILAKGFFDEILDWARISYTYAAQKSPLLPEGPADASDPLMQANTFPQFLEAREATVLVPVRPERAVAALYFFREGMTWTGREDLVPVECCDAALVCELTRAANDYPSPRPIGRPWEIAVPTSEQIVTGRSSLFRTGVLSQPEPEIGAPA